VGGVCVRVCLWGRDSGLAAAASAWCCPVRCVPCVRPEPRLPCARTPHASPRAGGERVLEVFDVKLKEAIYKLPFDKILTLKNVRNTINEADGYQPHIIAPEAGYRRLIEDGLTLLREPCAWLLWRGVGWGGCISGARAAACTRALANSVRAAATLAAPTATPLLPPPPKHTHTHTRTRTHAHTPTAAKAVEATHQILKSIVTASINEVPELQRYVNLKSEIVAHAAVTLDKCVRARACVCVCVVGAPPWCHAISHSVLPATAPCIVCTALIPLCVRPVLPPPTGLRRRARRRCERWWTWRAATCRPTFSARSSPQRASATTPAGPSRSLSHSRVRCCRLLCCAVPWGVCVTAAHRACASPRPRDCAAPTHVATLPTPPPPPRTPRRDPAGEALRRHVCCGRAPAAHQRPCERVPADRAQPAAGHRAQGGRALHRRAREGQPANRPAGGSRRCVRAWCRCVLWGAGAHRRGAPAAASSSWLCRVLTPRLCASTHTRAPKRAATPQARRRRSCGGC
jgi:hypothetical protein